MKNSESQNQIGTTFTQIGRASRLNWRTMQVLLIPEMDHFQLNNGPFSTQQWTIFVLTMAHCLDGCQFDSRLMRAGLEAD